MTTNNTDMDLTQKYDLLLHIVKESGFSIEKQIAGVQALFPSFDPNNTKNTEFINDYVLEQYAYAKSLGMTVQRCAHACGLSSILVNEALEGKGLDLASFLKVVEAELFATAEMRRKHLGALDKSSEDGTLKATIAFLEKIYPEDYGQKASLDLGLGEDGNKWEIEVTHVDAKDKHLKPKPKDADNNKVLLTADDVQGNQNTTI